MRYARLLIAIQLPYFVGCGTEPVPTGRHANAGTTADVLQMGTYIGGSDREFVRAFAAGPDGGYAIAGFTRSTDFPGTNGSAQPTLAGEDDVFVAKLDASGGLEWATYLGGSHEAGEEPRGLAFDADGNVYVTGSTYSVTDFPVTAGAIDNRAGANELLFLTKIAADGSSFIYSALLGDATGRAVGVGADGRATVVGSTYEAFPTTPGALQPNIAGLSDLVIAHVDSTGSVLLQSTYFGGDGNEFAYSAQFLDGGSVLIGGTTSSSDFPTTPGAFQEVSTDAFDIDGFVTILLGNGAAIEWSTYYGGSGGEVIGAVARHASGDVVLYGSTSSTDLPLPNALDATLDGDSDSVVARLSGDGAALEFATLLGSDTYVGENEHGIALDDAGNVYVFGSEYDAFPVTAGACPDSPQGSSDAYLSKLAADGSSVLYATLVGGSGFEVDSYQLKNAIVLDDSDLVTLAFDTDSTDLVATEGAAQSTLRGSADGYVIRMDIGATGSLPDVSISPEQGELGLEHEETLEIAVSPVQPTETRVRITFSGVLDADGSVLIPAGEESAELPVLVTSTGELIVTARLPARLCGGSASAVFDVVEDPSGGGGSDGGCGCTLEPDGETATATVLATAFVFLAAAAIARRIELSRTR